MVLKSQILYSSNDWRRSNSDQTRISASSKWNLSILLLIEKKKIFSISSSFCLLEDSNINLKLLTLTSHNEIFTTNLDFVDWSWTVFKASIQFSKQSKLLCNQELIKNLNSSFFFIADKGKTTILNNNSSFQKFLIILKEKLLSIDSKTFEIQSSIPVNSLVFISSWIFSQNKLFIACQFRNLKQVCLFQNFNLITSHIFRFWFLILTI